MSGQSDITNIVYDDLNRVIKTDYTTETSIQYCYDHLGNRTCRVITGAADQVTIDLTPTDGMIVGQASTGGAITGTYTNNNLGVNPSGSFTVYYILSSNGTYEPDQDPILQSEQVANLAGGAMETVDLNIAVPSTVTPASYRLLILLDPGNLVSELSETNNLLSWPLVIQDCESNIMLSGNSATVDCGGTTSGTVTASGGQAPYTYVWNTVPEQQGSTATGLTAGIYTITVTDALGCVLIDTYEVLEGETDPVANFGYSRDGLVVTFADMSVGGTSYVWDFGDGESSGIEHPVHIYAQAGSYEVCLTVINVCGEDEVCQTFTVGEGCGVPMNVSFSNIAQNGATVGWMGSGNTYHLRYRVVGSGTWQTVSDVMGNSYLLSGLGVATAYEVQLAANCGGVVSEWSSPVFFSTEGSSGGGVDNPNLVQTIHKFNKKFVPTSVSEFSSGDFVVVGFEETINSKTKAARVTPEGNIVWAREYSELNFGSPKVAAFGDFAYVLNTTAVSPRMPLVTKLDDEGIVIWSKQLNNAMFGWGEDIVVLANGDIAVVSESTFGDRSPIVTKLSPDGDVLLSQRYYEPGSDMDPIAITVNPATGNLGICGQFDGNGTNDEIGGDDVFFVRINPTNLTMINHGWFGSTADDNVADLSFDNGNRPILSGTTRLRGIREPFMVQGRSTQGTERFTYVYGNNDYASVKGAAFIKFPHDFIMVGDTENPNDGSPTGMIMESDVGGGNITADRIDVFSREESMTDVMASADDNVVIVGYVQYQSDYGLYFTKFLDFRPDFECIENDYSVASTEYDWDSEVGMSQQAVTVTVQPYSVSSSVMTWSNEGLCCNANAAIHASETEACVGETITLYSVSTGYDSLAWNNVTTGEFLGFTSSIEVNVEAPGSYTIELTAFDGGCSNAIITTVLAEGAPSFDILTTDATCNVSNGAASINPFDAGVSYEWSTGETGAEITDLPAGVYSVMVTGENGCTNYEDFVIENTGSELTLSVQTTNESCAGVSNGTAMVVVSGATGNLAVSWTGGMTGEMVDGLAVGPYSVTATDAAGCSASRAFVIEGPEELTGVISQENNNNCEAPYSGMASITASGGTPPFAYLWSGRTETTASIIGVQGYSGTVTVIDANGCEVTRSITIIDNGGDCPTCSDGVQNGDEEGIDCGGADCLPCCNNPEVIALIDMYDALDGENWADQTGWVDGAAGLSCDPCSWYGIGCDAQGRVNKLDFTGNVADGSMPSSLNQLVYLDTLIKSSPGFVVFSFTYALENLRYVDLKVASLSYLNSFPSSTGMKFFSLKEYSLRAGDPFQYSLNLWPGLEELIIHHSGFSDLTVFPTGFDELLDLRHLDLRYNEIAAIPPSINSCISLETVLLSGNEFSGSTFPSDLSGLVSLSHLEIEDAGLDMPFPAALYDLSGLETLKLRRNAITGGIEANISSLANLEYIDVSRNEMTAPLPEGWSQMGSLSTLNLANNQITGPLPTTIPLIPNLSAAYLSDNLFSGCWPNTYLPFCSVTGQLQILTVNNPNLPNGGNRVLFCADGTDACEDCNDGIQNGDETDIDCGGADCLPCSTNPTIVRYDSIVEAGNIAYFRLENPGNESVSIIIDNVTTNYTTSVDSIPITSDLPDVKYINLRQEGITLQYLSVQFTSCGWDGVIVQNGTTMVLEDCAVIKSGIAYVHPTFVDLGNGEYETIFSRSSDFGLDASNFSISARLKNADSEGALNNRTTTLFFKGSKAEARLRTNINADGSHSALLFITYEGQQTGAGIPSVSGFNLEDWNEFNISTEGGLTDFTVGGQSFGNSTVIDYGKLQTVGVKFEGSGMIDSLSITAQTGETIRETFDDCTCYPQAPVNTPEIITVTEHQLRLALPTPLAPALRAQNDLIILGEFNGRYEGHIQRDGNHLVFLPTQSFSAGEELNITLAGGLLLSDGNTTNKHTWKVTVPARHVTEGQFFLAPLGIQLPANALNNSYTFSTADFDQNGLMDIVFHYFPSSGAASNQLVYLRNPDQTFQPPETYTNSRSYSSLQGTPDLNGDGYPDLLVRHNVPSSVMIRLNNGDGSFATEQYYTVGNYTNGFAYGDIDADGDIDIISGSGLSSIANNTFSILTNDGSGNFTAANTTTGIFNASRHLEDLDVDGDLDLIYTSSTSFGSQSRFRIYENDGNGQLTLVVDQANPGSQYVGQVVDLNGDSYLDLLLTAPNDLVIYGDGTLNYDYADQVALGVERFRTTAIDIDADQDIDLLQTQLYDGSAWVGPLRVSKQQEGQTFSNWIGSETILRQALRPVDFDGDGDIDHGAVQPDHGIYLIENVDSAFYFDISVMLFGPYDTIVGLMSDGLRAGNHLPEIEPYGIDCQRVNPNVFAVNGPHAITDWIVIELRTGTGLETIVRQQSALLRRDGRVVAIDGVSPIKVDTILPADYHLVIRHRNHLAVMSQAPMPASLGDTVLVDFINPLITPTFGTNGQFESTDGILMMISGEGISDGQVNAVDINNAWRNQNGQRYNYRRSTADFNLDGAVNAVDVNAHWRIHNSKVSTVPD